MISNRALSMLEVLAVGADKPKSPMPRVKQILASGQRCCGVA
jgi:hypothetical protein